MYLKPIILSLILLATAAGGQRPNILFIAIDDLRPELGCYGAAQVKTPHIDKLAAGGMRFERAYCQVPICMGSRASLMTGMLPTAKRFVGDCRADVDVPDAMTLPEALRKAGYTTLSNGKIFHGKNDLQIEVGARHRGNPATTCKASTRRRPGGFQKPNSAGASTNRPMWPTTPIPMAKRRARRSRISNASSRKESHSSWPADS
jgi:arylsulfatase A-like enzyme